LPECAVSLDLSKTPVTDLTPFESWLGEEMVIDSGFGSRRTISVRDCSLRAPTLEVVKQGPEAVLNYLRELRRQGSAQLFEAKVMLLGQGRAGKTSLLRRLYSPGQPLPEEEQSTRGIEIHPQ
jgi:internalin A